LAAPFVGLVLVLALPAPLTSCLNFSNNSNHLSIISSLAAPTGKLARPQTGLIAPAALNRARKRVFLSPRVRRPLAPVELAIGFAAFKFLTGLI